MFPGPGGGREPHKEHDIRLSDVIADLNQQQAHPFGVDNGRMPRDKWLINYRATDMSLDCIEVPLV